MSTWREFGVWMCERVGLASPTEPRWGAATWMPGRRAGRRGRGQGGTDPQRTTRGAWVSGRGAGGWELWVP